MIDRLSVHIIEKKIKNVFKCYREIFKIRLKRVESEPHFQSSTGFITWTGKKRIIWCSNGECNCTFSGLMTRTIPPCLIFTSVKTNTRHFRDMWSQRHSSAKRSEDGTVSDAHGWLRRFKRVQDTQGTSSDVVTRDQCTRGIPGQRELGTSRKSQSWL